MAENPGRLVDGTKSLEKFISELHREKPQQFSHRQLKSYTSDFKCKIGSGAFGVVYKGEFSDGVQIAVKVLKNDTRDVMEMQFRSEVGTMGRTYHRNLIKLYGYCNEPDIMALVYEYMEKGSFDKILFENHLDVPWENLYGIAIEIAKGISYLHESCHPQIIHHDIKPDNVLLDSNLSPRLTDFGVAKLNQELKSQFAQTRFRGTGGYAAPEVCMEWPIISCKCDVYSFGMMMFDILGSKKNSGRQKFLPGEVWEYYKKEQLDKIITDCGIIGDDDEEDAKRLCEIALKCVEHNPGHRPSMSSVVKMLEYEMQPEKPVNVFPYDDVSGESSMGSGSSRNSRSRTRRMAASTYDERPLQNPPVDQKNKAVKSDSHQSAPLLHRSVQEELKNDFKKVFVLPDAASSEGGKSSLTIESFEKRYPPGPGGENSVKGRLIGGADEASMNFEEEGILVNSKVLSAQGVNQTIKEADLEEEGIFGNLFAEIPKDQSAQGVKQTKIEADLEEEGMFGNFFAEIPKVRSAQGVKQTKKEASSKAVQKQQKANIKEVCVSSKPQSRIARKSESMLQQFQKRCPPRGENVVIVYITKRGNKKDRDDSNWIIGVCEVEEIVFTVRDISDNSGYRNELKEVLGKKDIKVPIVFVKGRLIGGRAEIDKMLNEDKLEILFHGIPKLKKERNIRENPHSDSLSDSSLSDSSGMITEKKDSSGIIYTTRVTRIY